VSRAGDLAKRLDRVAAAAPASDAIAHIEPPAPALSPPRESARRKESIRLTFDLDSELHRRLRLFALDQRTEGSTILRALVRLLDDPAVRGAVLEELRHA
jgi:hypothetical protein